MTHRIRFLPEQIEQTVSDQTLLSDAARQAGVFIDAPCGGNGTCGKCGVLLTKNGVTNRVLACQTQIDADCTVTRINREQLRSLHTGLERSVPFAPYEFADRSSEHACFAAFDLGTTTIVCYLLDAATGEQIAAAGMQNPQSAYGADVIARANYTLTSAEPTALQSCAVEALNELLTQVCQKSAREITDVTLLSLVGNTVMHHLLLGYPLEQLVRAPYEPYRSERLNCAAASFGLCAAPGATLLVAPVIGGFVGADTVACLSATSFDTLQEPTLLLDIGTNGELALTNGTRRVCCSTAAGPAFEGANISCGMRAVSGAIDHAWIKDGAFCYSTIDSAPAIGLCGSGLIELCALLSNADIISESGKLQQSTLLGDRIVPMQDGAPAFRITDDGSVLLSQRDIRELQLGKAAMRAGIEVLLETLHMAAGDIKQTLLAGAFGAHLSAKALCDIGLLPHELLGSVESIGNAAGEGAKLYVRNFALFEASEPLARETEYLELTREPSFMDAYVDAMAFPREED